MYTYLTARPDAVVITPVNATVVMVTCSGSAYLPTRLRYNSIYNTTGAVMTRYEVVLPVGVVSVNVTLNDDVMGYVHKFSLNYVMEDDDETAPVTVETFVFGKHRSDMQNRKLFKKIIFIFVQIKRCFRFNLDLFNIVLIGR